MKRLLSLVLVILLCIGMLPVQTLATEPSKTDFDTEEFLLEDEYAETNAALDAPEEEMALMDEEAGESVEEPFEVLEKSSADEEIDISDLSVEEYEVEPAEASFPTSLYLRQSGLGYCTLSCAAMLIRARMYLSGNSAWSSIQESTIRSYAWKENEGLWNSFTYKRTNKPTATLKIASQKCSGITIEKLKSLLDNHPEGIILYCIGIPHAVFVTDYVGDTFYCADPYGDYAKKRIKLADSSLGKLYYGKQKNIRSNVTQYWYVSSYTITNDSTPVLTVKYNVNGGKISSDNYSANSSGMILFNSSVLTDSKKMGTIWHKNGLYNAATFGLSRSGYTFVGWSRSKDGSTTVFDQDDGTLKPETIYPNLKNGSATVTLYAIWRKNPDSVSLNKTSTELATNHSETLIATVKPAEASQKVTWTSSDSSVVTVSVSGVITAKQYGKAIITAKTENGKTAACQVQTRFYDVDNPSKSYYDAVYWAVDKGITRCTVNFRPDDGITRGEFTAFLYRLAGSPEVSGTTNKFSDVNSQTKFAKEITWAVKKGIIQGFRDGTFRPEDGLTRGQAATMIWRYAGKPAVSASSSPFKDVKKSNSDPYKAIVWGSQKGIMKGYSDGTFGKDKACTRASVVTFLYRYQIGEWALF